MKENINKADNVLKRLSIIEKARALSWYQEVDFGDGILVNIDKSGAGTERFFVTHADIDGVYAYPVSALYNSQDTDVLSSWGGGLHPFIERDECSREMERILDEGLLATGIDKDNPLVLKEYKYQPESVIFDGTNKEI